MTATSFPIGQKVLCTNGHFPASLADLFRHVPQEGRVYTIQEMFWGPEHGASEGDTVLSVRLAELPPESTRRGFPLWRFRLLDDIHELEALINPLALSS